MAKHRNFHIRDTLSGESLSGALKHLLRELSWAQVKKLILERHVQINGNLAVDEGRRVKTGDVIAVFDDPMAKPPDETDIVIRYLDEDLVVVEKPPGMTTLRHEEERDWPQRRKQLQPTLDELLPRVLQRFIAPQQKKKPTRPEPGGGTPGGIIRRGLPNRPPAAGGRGDALPRIYPVHRLDRDTSGLMLFAVSPRAEKALVAMFKNHDIQRIYWAVVQGRAVAQTIETDIQRDRGDGLRGSLPPGTSAAGAQHAITHVTPIEHLGNDCTVVECRLETGRTHQIRIHLSEQGHMLCGEKQYRSVRAGEPPRIDRSGAPRQALHAGRIAFVHPFTQEKIEIEMPLPPDLARWFERTRLASMAGFST